MPTEALVTAVKSIITLVKSGKMDESHVAYGKLFSSPEFATYPPNEQRQALKLMVLAKGLPTFPTPPIVAAHKAAIPALKALIEAHDEPADYELIGLCQVRMGDEAAARASFQRGLDLERARDPQSPLCGQLMKWVASV